MDRKLYEAALAGSVTALLGLLREDALILDRALVTCPVSDTPLHTAAILGHVDFAREILSRRPEFSMELNSQGLSPLHLAASKGYAEMVKELLKLDDSSGKICLVRDGDGRTPLHAAAIRGRLGVLKELVQVKPEVGRVRTEQGETILHLSVKHGHCDAAKWVLDWAGDDDEDVEFLNMKDEEGNTALHLSAAKRQTQTVKMLLSKSGVEVNAINRDGFTAADVLLLQNQNPIELSATNAIAKILEDAGAIRAKVAPTARSANTPQQQQQQQQKKENENNQEKKHRRWIEEKWSSLMVVAVLIATVTFEAGINPPGSNTSSQNFHAVKYDYSNFMVIDTTGFLASMSIIILLVSRTHLRPSVLMRILMTLTWVSITSVALAFYTYIFALPSDFVELRTVPVLWLGILYLWQLIRFVLWLLRKCGVLKKREKGPLTGGQAHLDIEMGVRRPTSTY